MLKKIVFSNLHRGTYHYTAVGYILFYDQYDNEICLKGSGWTTNTTTHAVSDMADITVDSTYNSYYNIAHAFDCQKDSYWYWLTGATDPHTITVNLLKAITVKKISFIPAIVTSGDTRGLQGNFYITGYDSNDNVIHQYEVTAITQTMQVQYVDTPDFPIPAKILFAKSNGTIWYFDSNNDPQQIPHNRDQLTVDDFNNYGNSVSLTINKSQLLQLDGQFDVLVYSESISSVKKLKVKDIMKQHVITSKSPVYVDDSSYVESITVSTDPSNREIPFLVSEDSNIWKYWDGSQWVEKSKNIVTDIFNDNSCVRLYKFDNNLNEEVIGADASIAEGSESYTDGVFDNSFNFEGVTRINLPNISLPDTYTISLWVKTNQQEHSSDGYVYNNPVLIATSNTGSNNDIYVLVKDGVVYIWDNNDMNNPNGTGKFIADDKWHHIVVVSKTGDTRLYVDKQLIDQFDHRFNVNTNNWIMGKHPNSGSMSFHGQIDQTRIFNKFLTESEIQQLYEEGRLQPSDFDSAMSSSVMSSLTWDEWKQIFPNEEPSKIYFSFRLTDDDDDNRDKLTQLVINTSSLTYEDVTDTCTIKQTKRRLMVRFNQDGEFKINYLD